MLPYKFFGATLAAVAVAFSAGYAGAQEFAAQLSGFNEIGSIPTSVTVPAVNTPSPTGYTGAILSDGTGTVKLDLDQKTQTVSYTLTYSNVGTTAPLTGTVLFAHIHLGKSHDSGGVLVFFCTNSLPFTGAGPTPPSCPSNSGTVTGTWTAMNVQAVPGQNVNAGDFNALVDALLSHTAYANVHTTALKGGEIRGQVFPVEEEHHRGQGNDQGKGQGH
jgi:CHRD domain